MLYFIDESGHDHKNSPYEVLAAVALQERDLWNLIQAIRSAEIEHFGVHLAEVGIELKGTKLLKKKTFRLANEGEPIPPEQRRNLTRALVLEGWQAQQEGRPSQVSFRGLVAYGQAVLAFVEAVMRIMSRFRVKVFAAVVDPDAPRPADKSVLRRDYAFLFERFFHHLGTVSESEMGLIVFDELEKTQSKILLGQMGRYFLETQTGYQRSARIVPEPFFVHSDLTTAVQLADLVAYCVSWTVRLNSMSKPAREELKPLADLVFGMRYVGSQFNEAEGRERPVYGMFHLDDLRPRSERTL